MTLSVFISSFLQERVIMIVLLLYLVYKILQCLIRCFSRTHQFQAWKLECLPKGVIPHSSKSLLKTYKKQLCRCTWRNLSKGLIYHFLLQPTDLKIPGQLLNPRVKIHWIQVRQLQCQLHGQERSSSLTCFQISLSKIPFLPNWISRLLI